MAERPIAVVTGAACARVRHAPTPVMKLDDHDALTRSLALELAGRTIPLGRMGTPEEVAEVVAFLATRGSYIQESVIHANGGRYGG